MICAKFGLNWTSGSGKLKTKNRNLSEMTSVQVYHRIEIEKPHTGITFTLSMCYQFTNCLLHCFRHLISHSIYFLIWTQNVSASKNITASNLLFGT